MARNQVENYQYSSCYFSTVIYQTLFLKATYRIARFDSHTNITPFTTMVVAWIRTSVYRYLYLLPVGALSQGVVVLTIFVISGVVQVHALTGNHYRSYRTDVLDRMKENHETFETIQYGALSHNPTRYPLMVIQSRHWNPHLPNVLVTGGVHGSETSGVEGCMKFVQNGPTPDFNLVVAPCVSPWAYEWGTRCQSNQKDPNRSFASFKNNQHADYHTEEADALMKYIHSLNVQWTCHIDLHETRPGAVGDAAMPPENNKEWTLDPSSIQQGFYLVGDASNLQHDFQTAVVDSMVTVLPMIQSGTFWKTLENGILPICGNSLGLCSSTTGATYVTTTEVCRPSPEPDETYANAQVAAIQGALKFLRSKERNIPPP